jgi:hypothetical protein
MTTRLLQGAQRTGPGIWQWGRWDISTISAGQFTFWLATDRAFDQLSEDEKTADALDRYTVCGFSGRDVVIELYAQDGNSEAAR